MESYHNCYRPSHERMLYFKNPIKFSVTVSKYKQLKIKADTAIKRNKVFSIIGECVPVRKALEKRGWVEKITVTQININENIAEYSERVILANRVAKVKPDFVWDTKEWSDARRIRNIQEKTKYNRIQHSYFWTTKFGLCASLRNGRWHYIEDVAEVNSPRTYTFEDNIDIEVFKSDFKLTACTSLLKWLLSMIENDRTVFSEKGTITINMIVFAVNRCKEYIFRKQHKDIDKYKFPRISNGQWNTFLTNYYNLMAGKAMFKPDKDNKVSLFMCYAEILLKEIHKHRPQLSCEGCHNMWIMKPTNSSRGRGIRIASKLGVLSELLNKNKSYVVQKYIEEPLLIFGTKFDIRQYYLVTSTYPMEIWMYKDSYLKFCSQEYNIINFHESVHLTNNAVQKKYTNCNNRNPNLPCCNMWCSETFKEYLNTIGLENVWDTIIYPGMKKSIVGIMVACADSMPRSYTNCFELYGCDFILDNGYKPWLIEINSCPDLNPTTPVTKLICQEVLYDLIKVVIDNPGKGRKTIGKFECIYRQMPETLPFKVSLEIRGHALPNSFFYRGHINLKENNNGLESQPDIAALLQLLKTEHYANIMQEPDINYGVPQLEKSASDKHLEYSDSDKDVREIATLITDFLDRLIGQIVYTCNCKVNNNSSRVWPSKV